MKKRNSLRKLNRNTDERKRLFKGLIRSFVQKGQIETSITKAKTIRPLLEKLVTKAKDKNLASFRHLIAETGDINTAYSIKKAGEVFKDRPGGYTRIIRLGIRPGDNTEMVRFEWVEPVQITLWPVKKEKAKTVITKSEKSDKNSNIENKAVKTDAPVKKISKKGKQTK